MELIFFLLAGYCLYLGIKRLNEAKENLYCFKCDAKKVIGMEAENWTRYDCPLCGDRGFSFKS